MSPRVCAHCGYANEAAEDYCGGCGASLRPPAHDALPAAEAEDNAPAPAVPVADAPERADAATPPEADTSFALETMAGLIPERIEPPRGLFVDSPLPEADAVTPRAAAEMQRRFNVNPIFASLLATGRPRTMAVSRQYGLYALLGLAALLSFWLVGWSAAAQPYRWDGTEAAWQTLRALAPGSRVLVYWQNEPAVAGELDLPLTPVLADLLAARNELHLLSQHPLGLPQARVLARRIAADLNRERQLGIAAEGANALVHEIGYWPGGYAVLPGLASWVETQRPDLHVIVTADMSDVLHWLELVAAGAETPVVAVTGAGAGPWIRPYLDSGQLSGLVSGYEGAQHYVDLSQEDGAGARANPLALHASAHNWLTAGLLAAFLAAVVFRSSAPPPRGAEDLES